MTSFNFSLLEAVNEVRSAFLSVGLAIGFLPKILNPLAARFITNVPKNTSRGVGHLRPIIEERRDHLNEYGKDWTEKPNDRLSGMMDEVPDATIESLKQRVLAVDFDAVHTTSTYAQPLREEVEAIVEKEGWARTSLSKMRKVDSFLKESIPIDGVDALGLTRKPIKDFTFSDGTVGPKGTMINAGIIALHHDDALYEKPEVFDPFRFADIGEEEGAGAKHQFVATSPEYSSFGHGRHACPVVSLPGPR